MKRVLVTGSSRGIGRAIARSLAADGWKVAVHYSLHSEDAEAVELELGDAASGRYQADLTNLGEAAALFGRVEADGPLTAVVNNAGVYYPSSFLDDPEYEVKAAHMWMLNLHAPVLIMRAAARTFAERGGGKILNVASRVGFRGEPGAAVYAATKAALINFTRSLAVELAPQKVGVFGIAPGWVETAMSRDGMTERLEAILQTIPLGRMASPEDCGACARFLLSDEAAYLSGEVIDINGASYFH